MVVQTGLDYMRSRTVIDCDTMDEEIAKTLGPFQDCTSNQAIAFAELSKPARAEVISASLADANTLHAKYSSITVEELAVEIAEQTRYATPTIPSLAALFDGPYFLANRDQPIPIM
ncbi:hypothetical protein PENARI_c002G12100 [Penicillium arizonense]|uniref:Uncharacterized protein n=1 Tax=Penicillium arizonense TaxID=1835702 RepID=A0A1F5LV21_PENAI|nr:hypothetical protein PENARI_c002G12100 [Penicillium arizonense]OGE56916.1 hypothetical protein PENARI_c002G12100 [Penicillium arizonense]